MKLRMKVQAMEDQGTPEKDEFVGYDHAVRCIRRFNPNCTEEAARKELVQQVQRGTLRANARSAIPILALEKLGQFRVKVTVPMSQQRAKELHRSWPPGPPSLKEEYVVTLHEEAWWRTTTWRTADLADIYPASAAPTLKQPENTTSSSASTRKTSSGRPSKLTPEVTAQIVIQLWEEWAHHQDRLNAAVAEWIQERTTMELTQAKENAKKLISVVQAELKKRGYTTD